MQNELEPNQKLLLWKLLVEPDNGMFLKDLPFKPSAAKRKNLQTSGLTTEQKKKHPETGRPCGWIELTDKGWEWCQDHLNESIESRSTKVITILNPLLQSLAAYFEKQDHCCSLGEMLAIARQEPATETEETELSSLPTPQVFSTEKAAPVEQTTEEDVLTACQLLADKSPSGRIRLKDLRPLLPSVPRNQVDALLKQLQQQRRLHLWPLDDPREITEEDRQAAYVSDVGTESHIVYLEGVLS